MHLLTNGIEYKLISEIMRLDKNNLVASIFPLGPLSPCVRILTTHLEIQCGEALRGPRRAQLSSSPTKALIMDNHTESPRLKERTEENGQMIMIRQAIKEKAKWHINLENNSEHY